MAGTHENGASADEGGAAVWQDFVERFRSRDALGPTPWTALFEPLRKGAVDDVVAVAQIGQSLDGRVATEAGRPICINGPAGLTHLHRLRALVDAVIVGVGTAIADDPRLTVRLVPGRDPARVVIDPNARLAGDARIFRDGGGRRILIVKAPPLRPPPGVEIITLPASQGRFAPADVLSALAARGLRRVLIEGGADTVSRFLSAGCLDRLHIIVAPIILGAGRSGFSLPPVACAEEAMRVKMHAHRIADEIVLDCDLSAYRMPLGTAMKST